MPPLTGVNAARAGADGRAVPPRLPDRRILPEGRRADRPRAAALCQAGRGFGDDQKPQAKDEGAGPRAPRRARRRGPKGKKSHRMMLETQEGGVAGQDALRSRQQEMAEMAVAAQEGPNYEEAVFQERLSALKRQGKETLEKKNATVATGGLYEDGPATPEPAIYRDASSSGQSEPDAGPGRAVIVGLSIGLVVIFLVANTGSGLPGRRARPRVSQQTQTAEKEILARAAAPAAMVSGD